MIGLITRISEFKNLICVMLFNPYVRPILEYGLLIWYPYYETYKQRIESIPTKLLNIERERGFHLDSDAFGELLGLSSLEDRRKYLRTYVFLFKILNRTFMYSKIDFYVPSSHNLRSKTKP